MNNMSPFILKSLAVLLENPCADAGGGRAVAACARTWRECQARGARSAQGAAQGALVLPSIKNTVLSLPAHHHSIYSFCKRI